MNRLGYEKSPYLLQHKNNPVDWYPWGKEAFDKAKGEGKPVFLSIGYSTCHWCHVMAHESFEDGEVARFLNDHYVAVKVDREERPDIDNIYMTVCQTLTGQGGWPLTVFLTPEQRPFFAGAYFPKRSRWGRPGLLDVLEKIAEKWQEDRERLSLLADQITGDIQRPAAGPGASLTAEALDQAYESLRGRFDSTYGGFGEAPKFPSPHNLMFLLRYSRMAGKSGGEAAVTMVEKTLLSMYRGGIYDHVGGGFARYSTDRQWLVPHFEKMLYDNALLACTFLETHQVTGSPFYARAAEDIFDYVAREMTADEGGFYSAQDADSEGVEGKYYLWTATEVERVLGREEGGAFCRRYDITEAGNFEGASIPNLIESGLNESASLLDVMEKMKASREKLYQEREKRIHPHKDDKVLTSWNGLMIAALAKGAQALQNPKYAAAAARAAEFVWERLRTPEGRLLARWRDGEAAVPGYLDDYAFLAWGFLELYRATFDPDYLQKAVELAGQMLDLFGDEGAGGLFLYGKDAEQLIAHPRTMEDGAMPSGNSVAALTLLQLSHLTGETSFAESASRLMDFFARDVERYPHACTFFLTALQFALGSPREIVLMAGNEKSEAEDIRQRLQKKYLPETALLYCTSGEPTIRLKEIAPFLKQYSAVNGKATLYLCSDHACQAPVTGREQMQELVEALSAF